MKISIWFLLVILALAVKAQNKDIPEDSLIKKWELATVNIEATTSLFMEPSIQLSLKKPLDSSTLINLTRNKVGSSGTAIFLKYENIHFLVTARHVLEDLHFPQPGWPYNQIFFPENYNIVSGNFTPSSLFLNPYDSNLHVGNFIFSPKETDIAIVALDAYEYETGINNIPTILKDRGYEPIDIGSIDTSDHVKTEDLTYSIGFPELSIIGAKSSIDTFAIFQSNSVTLPVVSVGKVLTTKYVTPYIISDAFVYHGNSGGPLIQNNKLIGIVHGPNLEVREVHETRLKKYYFLNGNQFIKAKFIMPLLREFIRRIKYNNSASKVSH